MEKRAVWILFVYVCVWGGSWGWMPLPAAHPSATILWPGVTCLFDFPWSARIVMNLVAFVLWSSLFVFLFVCWSTFPCDATLLTHVYSSYFFVISEVKGLSFHALYTCQFPFICPALTHPHAYYLWSSPCPGPGHSHTSFTCLFLCVICFHISMSKALLDQSLPLFVNMTCELRDKTFFVYHSRIFW